MRVGHVFLHPLVFGVLCLVRCVTGPVAPRSATDNQIQFSPPPSGVLPATRDARRVSHLRHQVNIASHRITIPIPRTSIIICTPGCKPNPWYCTAAWRASTRVRRTRASPCNRNPKRKLTTAPPSSSKLKTFGRRRTKLIEIKGKIPWLLRGRYRERRRRSQCVSRQDLRLWATKKMMREKTTTKCKDMTRYEVGDIFYEAKASEDRLWLYHS